MRLNHTVIENKAIGDVAYPSSNCYEFIKALKASTDMVADVYVDGKRLATSGVRFTIKDDWLCGRVSFRFSLASSRVASIVVVKVYKAGYRESTITLSSMAMVNECIDSGDQQAELQFVVMSVVPYNSRRAPRLKSSITSLKSSLLEPVNFEDLPADDTIEVEPDVGADYCDLDGGRTLHVGASADYASPIQLIGKSVSIKKDDENENGIVITYDNGNPISIESDDGVFTAKMINDALLASDVNQIEFSGGPINISDLPDNDTIRLTINAKVIIEHNLSSIRGLEYYDFGGAEFNDYRVTWNTSNSLNVNLQFNADVQLTGVNITISNGDDYSKPIDVAEGDGGSWNSQLLKAEDMVDFGILKLTLTAEALYADEGGGDHPITGDPTVTLNFTPNENCSYRDDAGEVPSLVWNTSNPIDFWIQLNTVPAQDIPVVTFDGVNAIQRDSESDQPADGLYHFIITRDQLPEPPDDGDVYNVGFAWRSDMNAGGISVEPTTVQVTVSTSAVSGPGEEGGSEITSAVYKYDASSDTWQANKWDSSLECIANGANFIRVGVYNPMKQVSVTPADCVEITGIELAADDDGTNSIENETGAVTVYQINFVPTDHTTLIINVQDVTEEP